MLCNAFRVAACCCAFCGTAPQHALWLIQGHALYTRQAGSTIPCPYVDYDKGFNAVFARAYGLKDGETISKLFGKDWGKLDPHSVPAEAAFIYPPAALTSYCSQAIH